MMRRFLLIASVAVAAACSGGSRDPEGFPDGCVAGELGCPRDVGVEGGDVCARGQCIGGTCMLWTLGDAGGGCGADQSCGRDLFCRQGRCQSCPLGAEGCACREASCQEGLDCVAGTCSPSD